MSIDSQMAIKLQSTPNYWSHDSFCRLTELQLKRERLYIHLSLVLHHYYWFVKACGGWLNLSALEIDRVAYNM